MKSLKMMIKQKLIIIKKIFLLKNLKQEISFILIAIIIQLIIIVYIMTKKIKIVNLDMMKIIITLVRDILI